MVTDLRGWIDFRHNSGDERWMSLATLEPFVGAYDAFGIKSVGISMCGRWNTDTDWRAGEGVATC